MRLALRFLATLVPLACASSGCGTIDDPTRDHGAPGSLRAAVFDRYDALAKTGALPHANAGGRADFSATVAAFVHPGMRFDDAATLFRQNGFVVGPLPPRALTGERWQDDRRHDLMAGLQVAQAWFVGRADVDCEIAPAAPEGDGAGRVGELQCGLHAAML